MKFSTSRVGDMSEMTACVWLMQQGYEVFRNVSSAGPIDLVAIKDGIVTLIDVGTAAEIGGKVYVSAKKEAKAAMSCAVVLYVVKNGECRWQANFPPLRAAAE